MTSPLVRRRVNNIWIRGVNRHIRHAGVFADGQHGLPCLPTVSGFVQPAIPARSPQRTLRRHINNFAVARVNHNATNMFGLLQPKILPTLATVFGLVNAVAVAHTALTIALSRPHPHDCRVIGIERDPANGI